MRPTPRPPPCLAATRRVWGSPSPVPPWWDFTSDALFPSVIATFSIICNCIVRARSPTIRGVRSTAETPGPLLLYERLADELEGQIRRGEYRLGERLPSVRRLHTERAIAIGTAAEAFAELERR